MSFFNGDYRKKPEQNLGGASREVSRLKLCLLVESLAFPVTSGLTHVFHLSHEQLPAKVLIERAAAERQARQDDRKRNRSATAIQSYYRKHRTRKRVHQSLRDEFASLMQSYVKDQSVETFCRMFQLLSVFYSPSNQSDSESLKSFGQILMKRKTDVSSLMQHDQSKWLHRVKKVLQFNVDQMNTLTSSGAEANDSKSQANAITIPLRLIEIYTDMRLYQRNQPAVVSSIWDYLIRNHYFTTLRLIIDQKIPAVYEETVRGPTPLAASLFDLMMQPLKPDCINEHIIFMLMKQMFTGPLSSQRRNYVLPALVHSQQLSPVSILNALIDSLSVIQIPANIFTMYTLLKLVSGKVSALTVHDKHLYLHVLRQLSSSLPAHPIHQQDVDDDVQILDDDQNEEMDETDDDKLISTECIQMMNQPSHVSALLSLIDEDVVPDHVVVSFSCICYSLLSTHPLPVNSYRLLYTASFTSKFLRLLWSYITTISTPSIFGSPTPLLHMLSRGLPIAAVQWSQILPQLTLFSCLLSYLLPTVDDVEFYENRIEENAVNKKSSNPFTMQELQSMTSILKDVCIGLVQLAYHDTKITVKKEYQRAINSVKEIDLDIEDDGKDVQVWQKLFKSSVQLLRQLYHRDSRRSFCPAGHWISSQVCIPVEKPTNFRAGIQHRRRYQQFVGLRRLSRKELESNGPPLSTTEIRNVTILQEVPFVVPFIDRVKIFQALMMKDKEETRGNRHHFQVQGSSIDINIRRNYIYEDAFEKLSLENEPDMRKPIRVQLMNVVGLDEAGIDGGGIFREFLSELLKASFDPNRGFFKSTHDRLIFPNPGAKIIFEDYANHYFFIGRMLGKALYENMLIELPLATFFLAKLLAKGSASDVDMHHLATLDPTMYKNLIYLKNYDADVADLGLDFTVTNSDYGQNEEIELKPGGKSIQVTSHNRIEYIHLMADYRLNKQIRSHCLSFKQGLANVIDLDWIRMFSPKELQVLISGTLAEISVADLATHTRYSGGYSAEHPVIRCFWSVVQSFDERQKRKLLKFVTSCSRPPLLGFKDLEPPFCIHYAGAEDRLPTASTCMNLLKLPEYLEKETLRAKLLYAIESGVGFELS